MLYVLLLPCMWVVCSSYLVFVYVCCNIASSTCISICMCVCTPGSTFAGLAFCVTRILDKNFDNNNNILTRLVMMHE